MKINPRIFKKFKKLFKKEHVPKSLFSDIEKEQHEEIQAFVFRELDLLKKKKSIVNHSSKIYSPGSFLVFFKNEKYHNSDLYYDLTTDDPDEFPDEF
jgi:hypothetical protein